jgi:hypothetical protein
MTQSADRVFKPSAAPLQAAIIRTMTPRHRETFEPVTLGHIRGQGCRDLLAYCHSGWCNHSSVMNADWLPHETRCGPRVPAWFAQRAG